MTDPEFIKRIYLKLEKASGKLDILLSLVRKMQYHWEKTVDTEQFLNQQEDTIVRISELFSVNELNEMSWIKDVYNCQGE